MTIDSVTSLHPMYCFVAYNCKKTSSYVVVDRSVDDVDVDSFAGALFPQLVQERHRLRQHTSHNRPSTYYEKGSPYSITERRVPELIPALGSQPAGDVSHKPGGRPAVTTATLKRAATNFAAW